MIARKSLLIILAQGVNAVVALVGVVILAKFWGGFAPTASGTIGFAMAFLGLFNFISDLGFATAHTKRISEGKDIGKCIGTYIAVKLVLTAVMVVVVLGGIFIWEVLLHKTIYDATTKNVIYVMLLYYVIMSLANIPLATFGSTKEIAKTQIPLVSESLFRTVAMILVVSAGVAGISVINPGLGYDRIQPFAWPSSLIGLQDFIAAHALGSLASTYVLGAFTVLVVGLIFFRGYPISRPSWEYFKSYFVFALPTILVSVIAVISTNIDKVMIGYFSNATEVGYYFMAQRISFLIFVIAPAVGALLFPTISTYHAKNMFEDIKKTVDLSVRYISMTICPAIVFIIVFRKPIIDIALSSAFYPAAPVLVVLSIYVFIVSLSSPYSYVVVGMNKPGLAAKTSFIACVSNIIMNALFIPQNGVLSIFGISGPTGAAIATMISGIINLAIFMFLAKQLVGIKISKKPLLHIFAGGGMGCMLYYVSIFTPLVRWYHLIIFGIVGLCVYTGILYLLKEFTKNDLSFLSDTLSPKKMAKYVKSELKGKD